MPQNKSNTPSGIHLVTTSGDKELNEEEFIQLLQILRLKNIPYQFSGSKEK